VRLINAIAVRLQYQPRWLKAALVPAPAQCIDVAYELRVQPWRVFYNVDDDAQEVRIEAVGYKVREKLLIEGQEVEL
jgi:hypothetical protein